MNRNYFLLLYFFLIVSLPFFSLRSSTIFNLSLTVYLLAGIFLLLVLDFSIRGGIRFKLEVFDYSLVVLLLISLLSSAVADVENSMLVFSKTLSYFFMYVALKTLLRHVDSRLVEIYTVRGIVVGSVLFIGLVLLAISIYKPVFSAVSYYGLTYRVFDSINLLIGNDEFESKNVMKNVLGEVFSFYALYLLIFMRRRLVDNGAGGGFWFSTLVAANVLLSMLTFSRRAFMSIITSLGIIYVKYRNKKAITTSLFFIVVLGLIVIFIVDLSENSRLLDLDDRARWNQYALVFDRLREHWVFGFGYAEKIFVPSHGSSVYVHSFIISNWYMLGVPGLVVSLVSFWLLLSRYLKVVFRTSYPSYSILLVIPLLGMLVGGTVEGIFTISSWIVLALISSESDSNSGFSGRT